MTTAEDRYAKLNYKAMPEHDEGFQAFRTGYNKHSKCPDGPYPNGDRRVAWLVGWLDARTKASMPHLFCLMLWFVIAASAMAQVEIVGTGGSKVPRFAKLRTNVLTVPANQTVTLASGEWDVIEIAGTAKVSRTADTTIKVTDLQILPGGTLDVGTDNDPVLRRVDVVFRNTPLLTGTDGALGPDPEQFGNGLTCFGQFTTYGRKLDRTFNTFQPTEAGATQITLTVPCNWQVGDELLFHDTRMQYFFAGSGENNRPLREESPVAIKAISGQTVTLSKPLDFEHHAVFGWLPYVANATRNIIFRSENPNGTRGHMFYTDRAHVSNHYTSFRDLGRTRAERIDNFNANTMHVGTNQIARYGGPHWHHVHGHSDWGGYTGRFVGNFMDGSGTTKWGFVQHGTHDLLVQDNVGYHFVGACFTAEDGFEVRGHYLNNLGAYCRGNGFNGKSNLQADNFAPGSEGSPFWLHGSQHRLEGNVALSSAIGYAIPHRAQVFNRSVPSVPGGANDTPLNPSLTKFISTKNNLAWSCMIGVETWNTPPDWFMDDLTVLNAGHKGIFMGNGESGFITLTNSKLLNDNSDVQQFFLDNIPNEGVHSSLGYTGGVTLQNVEIEGFHTGMLDAVDHTIAKGGRIKSRVIDVNWGGLANPSPFPLLIDGTKLEGPYKVIMGHAPAAAGTATTSNKRLLNWQGTGKNYYLFGVYEAPPGATKLDGVLGVVLESDAPPPPPPPPPTENRPPQVTAITANPGKLLPDGSVEVEEGTVVNYSASVLDLDGDDPLTNVISYSRNGGPFDVWDTVQGNSVPWSFKYGGPITYVWKVTSSDGKASGESTLTVRVVAKPVEPPPPVNEVEKLRKELDAERQKWKEGLRRIVEILTGLAA